MTENTLINSKFEKNRKNYLDNLSKRRPRLDTLIYQNGFSKYILSLNTIKQLEVLEKLYPELKGQIFPEKLKFKLLNEPSHKAIKKKAKQAHKKNSLLKNLNAAKNDYSALLDYVGNKNIFNILKINPTYENLCLYLKIDHNKLKKDYEDKKHAREEKSLRLKALKQAQIKKKFETDKKEYLSSLKQIKPTYKNLSAYMKDELFYKYTFQPATLLNVCIMAGYDENFATELQKKEDLRLHEASLKKIQREKEKFFSQLDQCKDNPDLQKIYTFLSVRKAAEYFNKPDLNLSDLCKYLKSPFKKQEIAEFSEIQNKIKALEARYSQYKNKLIHNMYVCDILGISKTEFARWKSDGRIPVAKTQSFRKWGKTLESDYFEAKDLLVSPEMLEKWRLLDEGKLFATPDEKRNKQWNKILADLRHEDISFDGSWFKIVSHDFEGYIIKTRLEIDSDIRIDNFKSIKSTLAEIREKSLVLEVDKVKTALERKIESFELDESERTFLLKNLSLEYKAKKLFDIKSNTFNSLTQKILEPLNRLRQATRIINTLQIDKYENSFPLARSMRRQINIIVGPTNSGKTWEALERLKSAKSGIYLAPLRLLALEIYEKLTEYGVPCNLITGEEHIIHPDAQHTAATVEMFDSQKAVEVAIIDEFQMLYDKQRGWAWTAAMVGVPAQEVFVIGAYQALPITQKLFDKIGEKYQVIEKERLSKLTVMNSLVSLNDLKKGDAIIAFSRKDVLSYATVLRKKKFKVSVIYGALSPEVRRRQAELFANGTHDIVVSTDAIGMGLNLPISRILFATIRKYDGEQVRELNATEIHQIAGRAGRYGIHEEGFVSLLQNKVNQKSDLTVVKHTLGNPPPIYKDPLSVAPNNWHIQKLSEILKETNLKKILIYFSSMTNDSIFQHANLEHMCLIYDRLDVYLKKFPLLEQYKLVCAPVSEHEKEVISYYAQVLVKLARNEPLSFYSPSYTQEKTAAYLERAEEDTKKLTLYMWLSHYYKNMGTDNLPQIRKNLSNYVSRALTSQNMESFSKMIEPYVSNYSRHDRYNPYDDDDDF